MSVSVQSAASAVFLLASALAGAAHAQTISDIPYTLDGADPTLSNHYHDACTLHPGAPSPGPYEIRLMTVTTPGVYSVTDISAPKDGSLAILVGALDTGALLTNCYASVDDSQSVFLNAGVYNLVLTTLGDGTGAYGYRFNGPAAVAFAPVPPVASVPTLSEWAMILFGALLLAAGGWTVQRRRAA